MKLSVLKAVILRAARHAQKTDPHVTFMVNGDEMILENIIQYQAKPDVKLLFKKRLNIKTVKEQ